MMLKFFNRSPALVARQLPRRPLLIEAATSPCGPIPVPEVVEGHEDADWKLWVSVVAAQSKTEHEAQLSGGPVTANGRHQPASIADYVRLDWYRDH